jgi:organic radical activating enzyme
MLKERGRWLDAVVFSGGEPCLQEDLADKMVEVLEQGFAVGLHTNGDFLTGKITELCDYILLSQHNREKIQIAKKAKHLSLSTVKWNKSLEKYENKIVVVK